MDFSYEYLEYLVKISSHLKSLPQDRFLSLALLEELSPTVLKLKIQEFKHGINQPVNPQLSKKALPCYYIQKVGEDFIVTFLKTGFGLWGHLREIVSDKGDMAKTLFQSITGGGRVDHLGRALVDAHHIEALNKHLAQAEDIPFILLEKRELQSTPATTSTAPQGKKRKELERSISLKKQTKRLKQTPEHVSVEGGEVPLLPPPVSKKEAGAQISFSKPTPLSPIFGVIRALKFVSGCKKNYRQKKIGEKKKATGFNVR